MKAKERLGGALYMIALPFRKLYRIRIVRYAAEDIIMLGYLAALMLLAGVCG